MSKKSSRPKAEPVSLTTDRQDEYLQFIQDFSKPKNLGGHGYPPTLDELADHMKVKVGSVQSVLKSLRDKGLVTWEKGQYRTLTVVSKAQ